MESKISLIFSKIGTTINELMDCSHSDFMGLNNQFQTIASDTNLFIQHTKKLLDTFHQLSELGQNELAQAAEASPKLNRYKNHNTTELNCSLAQIMDKTQNLKIYLKSLNQDLLTLRFLIASYQISGIDNPKPHMADPNIETNLGLLGDFKLDTHCSYKQVHEAVANTVNCLARINRVNKPIKRAYSQSGLNITLMQQCMIDADDKFTHVNTLLDSAKRDMAGIITNLQYHDIIGQKIAHVQQAHETITSNSEEQLAEVKSIANIQSAILIKANQEYQRSIESIAAQLKNISRSTTHAYSICNDMVSCYKQTFTPSTIASAEPDTNTLTENIREAQSATAEMQTAIATIVDACNTRPAIDKHALAYIKQWLNHAASQDTAMDAVLQQIATVFGEVERMSLRLNNTLADIAIDAAALEIQRSRYAEQCAITDSHNTPAEQHIPQSMQQTAIEHRQAIAQLHTDSGELRQQIANKTNTAVNSIRYYDVFEQKITSITNMLNEVFHEITNGTATPDKLEQIKEMYTMQSEHAIHESVVEGSDAIADDDDTFGDVELF